MKHVTENRDDVFLDGTGWEGGDEWIRAQFSAYLHALLAAVLQPGRTDTLSRDGDEGGHVKHLLCCCRCVLCQWISFCLKFYFRLRFQLSLSSLVIS